MSEVTNSFSSRLVTIKRNGLALSSPAAVCPRKITADIPLLLFHTSIPVLVAHFMAGFAMPTVTFFIRWIVAVAVTMVRLYVAILSRILADSGIVYDCSVPSYRCSLSNGTFPSRIRNPEASRDHRAYGC